MARLISALAIVLLGACADDSHPACAACGPDQICVQKFDGTCGTFQVECQDKNPACAGATCSPACDFWQCGGGADAGVLTCSAPSCGTEIQGALHCYGP
ncbi:MAG: hypothetical protein IPL61_26400 [Myxococcales bacterium]|nr:hypothetical protein [Myxococcales bacterium]